MINDTAINNFRDELSEIDISSLLNVNLATDPNTDYEKFETIISKTYDKHFLEKGRRSSISNALKVCLICINPLIYYLLSS